MPSISEAVDLGPHPLATVEDGLDFLVANQWQASS
jgi:hypothetical protein